MLLLDPMKDPLLFQLEHLHPPRMIHLQKEGLLAYIEGSDMAGKIDPHQIHPIGKEGNVRLPLLEVQVTEQFFENVSGLLELIPLSHGVEALLSSQYTPAW